MALPVWPVCLPLRTASEKRRISPSTRRISGITSLPSTSTGRSERLRNAVCSAARCSVELILSPLNMLSMCAGSPDLFGQRDQQFDRFGADTVLGIIE